MHQWAVSFKFHWDYIIIFVGVLMDKEIFRLTLVQTQNMLVLETNTQCHSTLTNASVFSTRELYKLKCEAISAISKLQSVIDKQLQIGMDFDQHPLQHHQLDEIKILTNTITNIVEHPSTEQERLRLDLSEHFEKRTRGDSAQLRRQILSLRLPFLKNLEITSAGLESVEGLSRLFFPNIRSIDFRFNCLSVFGEIRKLHCPNIERLQVLQQSKGYLPPFSNPLDLSYEYFRVNLPELSVLTSFLGKGLRSVHNLDGLRGDFSWMAKMETKNIFIKENEFVFDLEICSLRSRQKHRILALQRKNGKR